MLLALAWPSRLQAADWPFWRYDAQRSAASPADLPASLRLAWSRELPRLKPAWPDQPKLQFDTCYEPVVAGQRLFLGSSFDDSVTAFDSRSGAELWRFDAEGPVRFAPLVWQDKVYFVADDGYLYCLNVSDGALLWRFRGGPSDQKVLGNERLISAWPARGGPVIEDGKVYFCAGIWPFMGIFIHALDANTGQVIWTNDGDGSRYMKQPHNSDSFGGVAPQGPLVTSRNRLLIPGGRSVPAGYDRVTGQMQYYQLAEHGKRGGGYSVATVDKFLFNGGAIFDVETENYLGACGGLLTFAEGKLYEYASGELRALDLASAGQKEHTTVDRKGVTSKVTKWAMDEVGSVDTSSLSALIKAGSRLYAGTPGHLLAYDLPLRDQTEPAWEVDIEGTPVSLIAADDRLFAVTAEGRLYSFDAEAKQPIRHNQADQREAPSAASSAAAEAQAILEASGVREGYAVVLGADRAETIVALAQNSALRIVVIEPAAPAVRALRDRLQLAKLGAERVAVVEAEPLEVSLPPYFASLIVAPTHSSELKANAPLVEKLFASLRPYGGLAMFPASADEALRLREELKDTLANAQWKTAGGQVLLVRAGALPGSANWTHEHADAANTRVSKDSLVKAPLGLLWFGGPTNTDILPRHGHGPQPQVIDGRLIIEGVDLLRATDIYTGRVLWETRLPGLGKLFDNTAHQPGANASGTNYISMSDGIYVVHGNACVKLDPVSGKETARFHLPASPDAKSAPLWGYLNVVDKYLVGGADPVFDASFLKPPSKSKTSDDDDDKPKSVASKVVDKVIKEVVKAENDNYSSSQRLVVMDRQSGAVLWTATARSGFRHNAICIGGDRLYCIDRLSAAQVARLKRRGEEPSHAPRLVAYDLATGAELWSTEANVFGTWLSYSRERDVLVEAGRTARDTLSDEPKGMRAYRAATGSVLWTEKGHAGPAMIHHDTILMAGSACDLLTGAKRMRAHPLSGELVEWTWSRNYGCNTPLASEHLLTFRSGAAGYLDYCTDGGTGNFGGFRSSCTNNLIVAGGILSAPEYTRTCTCSYQNQSSIALVPMAEVETWTSFGAQNSKQPIRQLGINLGAPGDRKGEDGTLWLEYPSVGGSSPAVKIKTEPAAPSWFRRHSSQFAGPGPTWVGASGAQGLEKLRIELGDEDAPARTYRVRLHFAEPDDVEPGERVFDVHLQGKAVLAGLDVVAEAGGRQRTLVKEFRDVKVTDDLTIEFEPAASTKHAEAVLSGVEIHAEDG